MRVALIHDWLLGMRGGEKVLDALAELYPKAELFTLLADPSSLSPRLSNMPIHTSWMQKLPGVKKYYRKLLPFMPAAIERFNLDGYDLVISTSHCVAKGVMVPAGVPHVCYCHTPMRYAWGLQELYLQRVPRPLRSWAKLQLMKLREWDRASSSRVTQFIANGITVQQRIRECYGRDCVVVHPPVDIEYYVQSSTGQRETYYLVVSALAPNKRIDLAIRACQQADRQLVIIGTGPEEQALRRMAGVETTFLGWASNQEIRTHLQQCRALLFPGEEDFGIVPLEASACGCPVIALGQAGATETIRPLGQADHPTGLWFMESTVESLVDAITQYEDRGHEIEPADCRRQAEKFSRERFLMEMQREIARAISHHPLVHT